MVAPAQGMGSTVYTTPVLVSSRERIWCVSDSDGFSVVGGGLLILMWGDSFCVGGTIGRVESVYFLRRMVQCCFDAWDFP